jgi:hypothetical protein
MKFLVGAVREPPLRVDFHGKACGYHELFFDCNLVLNIPGFLMVYLTMGFKGKSYREIGVKAFQRCPNQFSQGLEQLLG